MSMTYDVSLHRGSNVPEFSYVEQAEYFQFLQEQMRQEDELNAYVSECMCFAEGASFKEFRALHEAITDKASAAWGKALDFIRRIWGKFMESVRNLVNHNNSYLKEYEDIILNREVKFASQVTMNNCQLGLERMLKCNIKVIDAATLDSIPVDPAKEEAKLEALRTRYVQGWNNGKPQKNPDGKEFVAWLKDYFQAADEVLTDKPVSAFNIRDMYTYCYDYNRGQIEKNLTADKNAIEKSSSEFEKEIKNAAEEARKAKAAEQTQAENKPEEPIKAGETKVKDKAKEASEEANARLSNAVANGAPESDNTESDNSSALISNIYPGLQITESVLQEMDFKAANSNSGTAGGATNTNDTTKTYSAAQVNQTNQKNFSDADKAKAAEYGKQNNSEEKVNEVSAKARVYMDVAKDIHSAKLTASEFIYNEFMQFIRAHVRSYVGNDKNSQARAAAAGTDYNKTAGNPQNNDQQNPPAGDQTGQGQPK